MLDADPDYEEADDYEYEEQTRWRLKILFSVLYAILFLLGTIGNGYVIAIICNILSVVARSSVNVPRKFSIGSTTHVFIYILGMLFCFVDRNR